MESPLESLLEPLLEPLLYVIALVVTGVSIFLFWKQNKNKSARTQAMFGANRPHPQATVVAKRTYNWPDRVGHYVTFQPDGAAPVEVEVTAEWYAYLNQGDRGLLTMQNGQFGGFQKAG